MTVKYIWNGKTGVCTPGIISDFDFDSVCDSIEKYVIPQLPQELKPHLRTADEVVNLLLESATLVELPEEYLFLSVTEGWFTDELVVSEELVVPIRGKGCLSERVACMEYIGMRWRNSKQRVRLSHGFLATRRREACVRKFRSLGWSVGTVEMWKEVP